MKKIILIVFFIFNILSLSNASAHPWRTDIYWWHTCYTNCSSYWLYYWQYHYHNTKNISNTYLTDNTSKFINIYLEWYNYEQLWSSYYELALKKYLEASILLWIPLEKQNDVNMAIASIYNKIWEREYNKVLAQSKASYSIYDFSYIINSYSSSDIYIKKVKTESTNSVLIKFNNNFHLWKIYFTISSYDTSLQYYKKALINNNNLYNYKNNTINNNYISSIDFIVNKEIAYIYIIKNSIYLKKYGKVSENFLNNALSFLDKLLVLKKDDLELLKEKANTLALLLRYKESNLIYLQLLNNNSLDFEILFSLWINYQWIWNYDKSIFYYNKLISIQWSSNKLNSLKKLAIKNKEQIKTQKNNNTIKSISKEQINGNKLLKIEDSKHLLKIKKYKAFYIKKIWFKIHNMKKENLKIILSKINEYLSNKSLKEDLQAKLEALKNIINGEILLDELLN